jgi:hypothetical protein
MSKLFDLVLAAVVSFVLLALLGLISKLFWLAFGVGWGAL